MRSIITTGGVPAMPSHPPHALRLAVAALVAAALLTTGASLAQAGEHEFYAPGHKVECAVSDTSWHGAMCQVPGFHYAKLAVSGRSTICSGASCPYSNAAENTPVLAHGKTLRVGRFSCTSSTGAIRCVVRSTGRGFRITASGAKTVGTS
jgi:hypothetical protein